MKHWNVDRTPSPQEMASNTRNGTPPGFSPCHCVSDGQHTPRCQGLRCHPRSWCSTCRLAPVFELQNSENRILQSSENVWKWDCISQLWLKFLGTSPNHLVFNLPLTISSQNASRNCFFSGAVLSWGKKGTATCLRRLGDTWGKRQKVKKVQNAKAKKTREN